MAEETTIRLLPPAQEVVADPTAVVALAAAAAETDPGAVLEVAAREVAAVSPIASSKRSDTSVRIFQVPAPVLAEAVATLR